MEKGDTFFKFAVMLAMLTLITMTCIIYSTITDRTYVSETVSNTVAKEEPQDWEFYPVGSSSEYPVTSSSEGNIDELFTIEDIEAMCKTLHGEGWDISKDGRIMIIECILNRFDSLKHEKSIAEICKKEHIGYNKKNPIKEDDFALVLDVIHRWQKEKKGEKTERLLPKEYIYSIKESGSVKFYYLKDGKIIFCRYDEPKKEVDTQKGGTYPTTQSDPPLASDEMDGPNGSGASEEVNTTNN